MYTLHLYHDRWDPAERFKHRVYFRHSTDDGLNWSDPKEISSQKDCNTDSFNPLAAGPGGAVAAAWAFPPSVRVNTSPDYGGTWRGVRTFSAAGGTIGHIDLVYDTMGNLMIVWVESGIVYFRRSMDNGATWSVPVEVNATAGCSHVKLAVSGQGRIFVSWLRGNRIRFVEGTAE